MYNGCGISFEYSAVVTPLKSVAVTFVNPILNSDGLSVKSDNDTLKSGREVGAVSSSPLTYNRQSELKLSLSITDLGVLRSLYRTEGASACTLFVGRVDVFANGQYDTPQTVSILEVGQIKRVSSSFYECVLRVGKL